jgi:hypothetical protein
MWQILWLIEARKLGSGRVAEREISSGVAGRGSRGPDPPPQRRSGGPLRFVQIRWENLWGVPRVSSTVEFSAPTAPRLSGPPSHKNPVTPLEISENFVPWIPGRWSFSISDIALSWLASCLSERIQAVRVYSITAVKNTASVCFNNMYLIRFFMLVLSVPAVGSVVGCSMLAIHGQD